MAAILCFAIEASSELAAERGAYSSCQGSLWGQVIFPISALQQLVTELKAIDATAFEIEPRWLGTAPVSANEKAMINCRADLNQLVPFNYD